MFKAGVKLIILDLIGREIDYSYKLKLLLLLVIKFNRQYKM